MFFHNFKYTLKTLFRNKALIFWTFAFPIILGTLFKLAFSNIENKEKLDIIDIAIVDDQNFEDSPVYKEVFKTLGDKESDEYMFNITYTDKEASKKMLEDEEITGYLVFTDKNNVKITVNESGINETVLRYVVDEIASKKEIIENLVEKKVSEELAKGNFDIKYEEISSNITSIIQTDNIKLNNISNKNMSYTMIEYYTLIAMTALYGSMISLFVIDYKLANMNSVGKRTSISPMKKDPMILGSLLASYIVQIIGLVLLFVYTIFVMKVDYGDNLLLVCILALAGSLAGLALGVAVGTLVKSNENTKTGILLATTMIGCFLSGMMGITMKYVLDKNVPILNKINPANMITDGFYSLYYYNTLDRYYFDVLSLVVFSAIMIIISYGEMRRQKYDSI